MMCDSGATTSGVRTREAIESFDNEECVTYLVHTAMDGVDDESHTEDSFVEYDLPGFFDNDDDLPDISSLLRIPSCGFALFNDRTLSPAGFRRFECASAVNIKPVDLDGEEDE